MSRVLTHRFLQSAAAALLLAGAAHAQIWPETWHGSNRLKQQPVTIDDAMLWVEYGGDASELATYNGPVGKFQATAWRLKDATSALAWYQAVRPANCAGVPGAPLVCTTSGAQFMAHDNYVLRFDGWRPLDREMAELYPVLPRMRSGGGLPNLPQYLPEKGLIRNSERYILGLHSLEKFAAAVPGNLVGFEDGVEGQLGRFQVPGGAEATVVVFDFTTPQLAMQRVRDFEKQSGWTVQRTGPYVSIVPGGVSPEAAKAILGKSEWHAIFTWNTPGKLPSMPNVGGMLVAIFELTGVLLVACLGGGILFAGLWVYLRRRRIEANGGDETITIIPLHDYPPSQ